MTKSLELEVYSDAGNHWVVKTPGRQFPALVIQGDTFHSLYVDVRDLANRLDSDPHVDDTLREEAASIVESIRERLLHYERVLDAAGLRLPYTDSVA